MVIAQSWVASEALVEEAQRRGYLTVDGERISYHCRRDRKYNYRDPEEQVRARTYSWFIIERSYTPNKKPRQFQVGTQETPTEVANRIRALYKRARRNDPSVFADESIDLPDDKIAASLLTEIPELRRRSPAGRRKFRDASEQKPRYQGALDASLTTLEFDDFHLNSLLGPQMYYPHH